MSTERAYPALLIALLDELPKPGTYWPEHKMERWIAALRSVVRLLYGGDKTLRVEAVKRLQAEIPADEPSCAACVDGWGNAEDHSCREAVEAIEDADRRRAEAERAEQRRQREAARTGGGDG